MLIEKIGKLILFLPFLNFNIHMNKQQQEDIPKSIVKESGAIGADLSSLNGKGKLLFVDPKCFIIGIDDLPYTMFTTPEFNANVLPIHLRESIYGIKSLVFKSSFFVGKNHTSAKICEISSWITDFKHLEYLQLENVDIDNLGLLKNLPIEHLSLKAVIYANDTEIFLAIKRFKYLKEISYDQSIATGLKHEIKKLHLKTTLN